MYSRFSLIFCFFIFNSCDRVQKINEEKTLTETSMKDSILELDIHILKMLPVGWGYLYSAHIQNKTADYTPYFGDTIQIGFTKEVLEIGEQLHISLKPSENKNKQAYLPPMNGAVLSKQNNIWLIGKIEKNQQSYTLTIKQGKYEKSDEQTFLVVPTTLTNNTDDTLKYLSMSCSWLQFYCLNSNKMNFNTWLCSKNIPIMLTLAPHKCIDTEIKLVARQAITTSDKISIQIGMYLVKVENEHNLFNLYNTFLENELKNGIIWSNIIEM